MRQDLYVNCPFCGTKLEPHSKTSDHQQEKCPKCHFNQYRYFEKKKKDSESEGK